MSNGGGVQATSVAQFSDADGEPVVFELRQVRLPAEWSQWQRAMWLDSQAVLWGEMGIVLDGDGDVIEAGADAVSNAFAAQSNAMANQLTLAGVPEPDDYIAGVDSLWSRVFSPDVPVAGEGDRSGSGGDVR
jgi:hypothetical protein